MSKPTLLEAPVRRVVRLVRSPLSVFMPISISIPTYPLARCATAGSRARSTPKNAASVAATGCRQRQFTALPYGQGRNSPPSTMHKLIDDRRGVTAVRDGENGLGAIFKPQSHRCVISTMYACLDIAKPSPSKRHVEAVVSRFAI